MTHPGMSTPDEYQVLIVEDDDDSREMLSQLAEVYGYRVRGAATAEAAVECALENLPQLALVDIGLADTDGFEVAQRLRRIPGGERVRLVALTGYSDDGSRSRAEASGFDEFVVKPLMPERFSELLSRWAAPSDAVGS
jgi:CheY-like chemotaxis protein